MATYKTPGVYVEEISKLPPSVAEVSTAIPAFLGYTSAGRQTARISTLLEYEEIFGTAQTSTFNVTVDRDSETGLTSIASLERQASAAEFLMYYSLSLYFKNGGGPCYIVSIGDYSGSVSADDFTYGLGELEKEDEPTIIVLPDAVNLADADYFSVYQAALAQCNKLGDRFAVFDVKNGDVEAFRNGIGTNFLKYGAAYMPYLATSLTYQYDEGTVNVTISGEDGESTTLSATDNTALYSQVITALRAQRVTLPPSSAIAGIYAMVDRERGVWKAPANVSISSIIGPVAKITHAEQEGLNVDPTSGKSINAIRAFVGKGTLVWGARTLAGNDNEWRYVSVRRLFNVIEESTQKSTSFAVFEPNDTTTWLKVKAMIESYLYGLWEQGALAGPTPEAAYFVNVGLGKTMTAQDVLEGRMIVEIGVAAVRPAEFIILRFSHKLQEA